MNRPETPEEPRVGDRESENGKPMKIAEMAKRKAKQTMEKLKPHDGRRSESPPP
ncbi:hypothetical protein [Streptomyces lydicus]|uniref:hypothetical protein n=1 Tax=Streptomyces lydicus TaxID=47763 RepID=UPI0013DDA9BA|nr:hypothetical protein [Streptomyces lydicus]